MPMPLQHSGSFLLDMYNMARRARPPAPPPPKLQVIGRHAIDHTGRVVFTAPDDRQTVVGRGQTLVGPGGNTIFAGQPIPVSVKPGEHLVNPVTKEAIYARASEPTYMSVKAGERVVNADTGSTIFASPPPTPSTIRMRPGEHLVNPGTGEVMYAMGDPQQLSPTAQGEQDAARKIAETQALRKNYLQNNAATDIASGMEQAKRLSDIMQNPQLNNAFGWPSIIGDLGGDVAIGALQSKEALDLFRGTIRKELASAVMGSLKDNKSLFGRISDAEIRLVKDALGALSDSAISATEARRQLSYIQDMFLEHIEATLNDAHAFGIDVSGDVWREKIADIREQRNPKAPTQSATGWSVQKIP